MAGYSLKSFLIAQSLNQIEKAYGQNNSILDNCHVRVAFATNDERTAKRVSDALGIATELRAMKNYAGHRLAPWLGHLMVSRQETARPLLTAGEVMQLPATDQIVLMSGTPPIRATKARYFDDRRLTERIRPPPATGTRAATQGRVDSKEDDWTSLPIPKRPADDEPRAVASEDAANGGIRREPALPEHEAIALEESMSVPEFTVVEDEADARVVRSDAMRRRAPRIARQAAMDPDDGVAL
jgi:type IV secretion system protein VirD4